MAHHLAVLERQVEADAQPAFEADVLAFELDAIVVDLGDVGDTPIEREGIGFDILEILMIVIECRYVQSQRLVEKGVLRSHFDSVVGLRLEGDRNDLLAIAAVDPAGLIAARDADIDHVVRRDVIVRLGAPGRHVIARSVIDEVVAEFRKVVAVVAEVIDVFAHASGHPELGCNVIGGLGERRIGSPEDARVVPVVQVWRRREGVFYV